LFIISLNNTFVENTRELSEHINNNDLVAFHLDERSFQQLYRTYWQKIFGICYFSLKDKEVAAELTQDIFESLWKRRDTLKLSSGIEEYMFRSAKLEVFQYCRTTANRKRILEHALKDHSTAGTYTEDLLKYRELSASVNSLVDQLPSRSREIYRLSREKGLDKKSIAQMLLVSEKTVEYHLYKVLDFLRENLVDYNR